MNTPKYTFLLPAFKAKFFAEALKSIKNQTLKDFVCLVSDDCSSEDLKGVFDSVVGNDLRFTFRRNAENMGSKSLVSHWNLLVDMCKTEFLIMASDDDIYELNFLEEIDVLTEKYPYVNLFRGKVRIIGENKTIRQEEKEISEICSRDEFLINHFSGAFIKCISNFVFRTKALKGKGYFIETPLAWFADEITTIELSSNGCANTSSVLFSFRCEGQNISSSKPTPIVAGKKAEAVLIAYKWLCKYINKLEKSDKKERTFINAYQLCIKGKKDWGERIYWWLMISDFKSYIKLLPLSLFYGIWNWNWVLAVSKHQFKTCLLGLEK